jgi:tetratricopeptide (TPR) repeat protein
MNNNYTNTELLTRYLDGELEGEPLKDLETRIKEDLNLRQELDDLKVSMEAIRTYGLYNKVSSVHADMMEEFRRQSIPLQRKTNKFFRNALRIAATVIIILGSLLVYQYANLSPRTLFKDNFQSFALHENRGTEIESPLQQQYKLTNYPTVTVLFQQLKTKTIQDYFIAGNAYLQQNNSAEAIKCFESVQEINGLQKTHVYEDDTEYYLAMSYLRNQEPQKAIPIFEKIHSDKSHLYNSKVSEWFLMKLHWLPGKS